MHTNLPASFKRRFSKGTSEKLLICHPCPPCREAGGNNKLQLTGKYDLVFISNIIHMNNETQNLALFKKAFAVLRPGGKMVVKDHLMNEDLTSPPFGAIFSLHMLLHTDGRDYGYHEVDKWLKEIGCRSTEILKFPADTQFGIITGTK